MKKIKTKNILLKQPKEKREVNEWDFGRIALSVVGAIAGNFIFPGIGGAILGGIAGASYSELDKEEKAMTKIPVFYSFHFNNDVMRVQQIRNIGAIEGNSPTSPNEWERLKRVGSRAVENWINLNMKYKRCVIVLIGEDTASRPWVQYEIRKAWNDGKALLGIHIHNLRCPRTGTSRKGRNPFDQFRFEDKSKLSSVVPCYDPSPTEAYKEISKNISTWITHAINNKRN